MLKRNLIFVLISLLAACNFNEESSDNIEAGTQSSYSSIALGPDAPFTERVQYDAELDPCILLGGTMGVPDPVTLDFLPEVGDPLLAALSGSADESFPEQIHLRSDTGSYNRRYQFYLHEGSLWYKPNTEVTGVTGEWAQVPTPSCLAGTMIGISADDDELIAIRKNGDIYGLDNILDYPALFNWTSRWGTPVWFGLGYHIQDDYLAWSWTVISNSEDENWTDTAGNLHRVGDGKVSHIWMLRKDGQRFGYIDPWLAHDESYETCGPLRGRFKAVNLNTSGSTLMTINRYGDLFTRHFDFDLGGTNEVFFQYSFEDQRNVSNPVLQLPSYDWVQQPKVPGQITHNISIHKVGKNLLHRIMRIEGMNDEGKTGYWEKDIVDMSSSDWSFVRTDEPLRGTLLENSLKDTSSLTLAENEDTLYSRNMSALKGLSASAELIDDNDWAAELTDFNFYCSPTNFRIHTPDGESMDLILHVVDVIRQTPRARGLDDSPRSFRGAVEVPDELLARLDSLSPQQQTFINKYLGDKKFTEVDMSGVADAITITKSDLLGGFNWVFNKP